MDKATRAQVLEDSEGGCAPFQGVAFLPLPTDAEIAQTPLTLEALESPSSAVPLFVVPVVMRHRRDILSPARAAGGRHLERQRLRAAVIALIGAFCQVAGTDLGCVASCRCPGVPGRSWGLVAPLKNRCWVPCTKLLLFLSPCSKLPAGVTDALHFPRVSHRLPDLTSAALRRQNCSLVHKSIHWTHISGALANCQAVF